MHTWFVVKLVHSFRGSALVLKAAAKTVERVTMPAELFFVTVVR